MTDYVAPSLILFVCCLLVLSNLSVGVADISIGVINLAKCTIEPLLPIALVVNGGVLVLLGVVGIWGAIRINTRGSESPKETERLTGGGAPPRTWTKCVEIVCWLISTVAFAWATLTLYMALKTHSVYSGTASSSNYCEPDLVLSGIILASVTLGNVVTLIMIKVYSYVTNC